MQPESPIHHLRRDYDHDPLTEVDLDRHLRTAVSFAEPMLLFFIAGFIGTIFISMVLPIFEMQEYIK